MAKKKNVVKHDIPSKKTENAMDILNEYLVIKKDFEDLPIATLVRYRTAIKYALDSLHDALDPLVGLIDDELVPRMSQAPDTTHQVSIKGVNYVYAYDKKVSIDKNKSKYSTNEKLYKDYPDIVNVQDRKPAYTLNKKYLKDNPGVKEELVNNGILIEDEKESVKEKK